MDLDRKGNLSRDEADEITVRLQCATLDQIFRKARWTGRDAVFHGGTSLNMYRQSGRFSEDLDFMLTDAAMESLSDLARRVRNAIEPEFASAYPNCRIEVSDRTKPGARVAKWEVKWSHPARQGKVKVKTEFCRVPEDALGEYAKAMSAPLRDPDTGASVRSRVPIPEVRSVYADKIVALALRPYLKHRDIYDLDFLVSTLRGRRRSGAPASAEEAVQDIVNVASIYDADMSDIRKGLDAFVSSEAALDGSAMAEDMRRWLPTEEFEALSEVGDFERMLEAVREEAQDASVAVASMRNAFE